MNAIPPFVTIAVWIIYWVWLLPDVVIPFFNWLTEYLTIYVTLPLGIVIMLVLVFVSFLPAVYISDKFNLG